MNIRGKEYRHIIWDWNGTLLDDTWLCVEVINDLLGRRSLPLVNSDSYRQLFGFPVRRYYERLGFDFHAEPFEKVAMEFIDLYVSRRDECRLHDDAVPCLHHFRDAGLEQSILSAHQQESLQELTVRLGVRDFFSIIRGLDDHYAHSKTESGQRLLVETGLPAESLLLIGDTTHDFETAQCMGIDCLLISHGHQPRKRLEACGCPVRDSLSDIFS